MHLVGRLAGIGTLGALAVSRPNRLIPAQVCDTLGVSRPNRLIPAQVCDTLAVSRPDRLIPAKKRRPDSHFNDD